MTFSLAPLLVVTLVGQRGIIRMGETITGLAKVNRTAIVTRELQQTAEDYAKILGREKAIMEITLKTIAREAERLLSERSKTNPSVYFAEDFDNPDRAPKDLNSSPRHPRIVAPGETELMLVSYGHQVFFLKPGIDKRLVMSDVYRLSRLLPLLKELEGQLGDMLYWQYVSLESGVHAAYPGHGGYPPGYNPQSLPWYIHAREDRKSLWHTPYLDTATRQVIMTASMPLHRPDGSFAGVAAIDVLLAKVLQSVIKILM